MAALARSPISILIINPNSSSSMTAGLESILADLLHPSLVLDYHTGPAASPPSVNDLTTAVESATHTFSSLQAHLRGEEGREYDGYLVACYSDHPLVGMLREHTTKTVLGIFEASIMHALALGRPFGIVTTGKYWEGALTEGVRRMFGSQDLGGAFVGVESTGLSALELHVVDRAVVTASLSAAASRVVRRGARAIITGCAGMSGMEAAVRAGAASTSKGKEVVVVDGVRAGIVLLEDMVRAQSADASKE